MRQDPDEKKAKRKQNIERYTMSMRGEVISREYQRMVWVKDETGKEFACYAKDVKDRKHLSDEAKDRCLDTSLIAGDSW